LAPEIVDLALARLPHSRPRRSRLQCMNYGGGPVEEELAEGAPTTEAPCPFDAGLWDYAESPLDPALLPSREPAEPRSRGRGGSARPRSQGSRHPVPAGDFAGVTAAARCVAEAKPLSSVADRRPLKRAPRSAT